jgi:hypothetical protein
MPPPAALLLLQRLMQAVEEGRALLLDSSLWQPVSPRQLALQQAAGKVLQGGDKDAGSSQQPQQQPQPVLLPYPAPLPDDAAKRSSKQLLKWLQAAALAPEVRERVQLWSRLWPSGAASHMLTMLTTRGQCLMRPVWVTAVVCHVNPFISSFIMLLPMRLHLPGPCSAKA